MSGEDGYRRELANGPLDRKLLRAAADGLSPREMSRAVGGVVTPEQALQRINDLLDSRDYLTNIKAQALVIEDINDLLSTAREYAKAGSHQHLAAATRLLKIKLDQLNQTTISPQDAARIIREGHGRIMLEAINLAFQFVSAELERRRPELPPGEVHEIFVESMPRAIEAIESRVEG